MPRHLINTARNKYYFNQIIKRDTFCRDHSDYFQYNVYIAYKNNESEVAAAFIDMNKNEFGKCRSLSEMIAILGHEFTSRDKLTWPVTKFTYGELKPKPHRFFFFQCVGKNLIYYAYRYKPQTESLGHSEYKKLDKLRADYEKAFRRQYSQT